MARTLIYRMASNQKTDDVVRLCPRLPDASKGYVSSRVRPGNPFVQGRTKSYVMVKIILHVHATRGFEFIAEISVRPMSKFDIVLKSALKRKFAILFHLTILILPIYILVDNYVSVSLIVDLSFGVWSCNFVALKLFFVVKQLYGMEINNRINLLRNWYCSSLQFALVCFLKMQFTRCFFNSDPTPWLSSF